MKQTTAYNKGMDNLFFAFLFIFVVLIIGYALFFSSIGNNLNSNRIHYESASMVKSFQFFEIQYYSSNEEIKNKYKILRRLNSYMIDEAPDYFSRYQKILELSEALEDNITQHLGEVFDLILIEFNGSVSDYGITTFENPFIKISDFNQYHLNNFGVLFSEKIMTWRQRYLDLIPPDDQFLLPFWGVELGFKQKSLNLEIDGHTLYDFFLKEISISAIPALFRLIEYEVSITKKKVAKHIMASMGSVFHSSNLDHFIVNIPVSDTVYQGDLYSADISMVSIGPQQNLTEIRVNNNKIPFYEYSGKYEKVTNEPGTHTYDVEVVIRHPVTGSIYIYSNIFEYTVIPR
ncbi:MAG: hypothetical protein EA362_13590 [Saprospirales bacterium]|nr:MAG: hypothetical protein EA362_13590 [Saprospirales bacterium]